MNNKSMNIPGDNEVLFSPYPSQIYNIIKQNRKKINNYSFKVFGQPFALLRETYRQNLRRKAHHFTDKLEAGEAGKVEKVAKNYSNTSDYLVITGHQPEFYHPGIWIKNLFLSELIKQDKTGHIFGINLNLDHDIVDPLYLYCPALAEVNNNHEQGYSLNQIILSNDKKNIPLQKKKIPTKKKLEGFLNEVKEKIKSLSNPLIYKRFSEFCNHIWRAYELCTTEAEMNQLGIFLIASRRYYEESLQPAYYEIPFSFLQNNEEFLLFFLELVSNIESFALIYNQKLHQYRTLHKIRNKVNPIPDLQIAENRIETPFWVWQKGKNPERKKLFLIKEKNGTLSLDILSGKRILLISSEKEKKGIILERLKKIIMQNKINISPRALIFTLFQRLFGADLFIHGIGGSKYDWITDQIIEDYFKVTPPEYFSVSATIPMDFKQTMENKKDLSLLQKKKRDIKHNPEKIITEANLSSEEEQQAQELIQEKMKLVQKIQKADKKEKPGLSARIKQSNKNIKQILAPYEEYLTRQIAGEEKKRKQEKILKFREYPYCFYGGKKIIKLLNKKMIEV